MTTKVRMLAASLLFAAFFALLVLSAPTRAAGEKSLKGTVLKIADALKSGDKATAKKLAEAAVKNKDMVEEISDVMHMFRPREKGGMGVGAKTFGNNKAKDGIEITLRDLARDVPSSVTKQAEALEATGYYIAAISELSIAKGWDRDSGKKTKKAWKSMSEDLQGLGIDFAKASAGKGAQQIKSAAAKLNENCNRCHSVFKE